MMPLMINPLPLLGGAVVTVAIGFGAGWAINGWRLQADVADAQKATAEARARSANTALDQLAGRIETMNKSAATAQLDVSALAKKMDVIRKEQKDAQAARPLDPGCKPDDVRLLNLRQAVGAANAAIAGSSAR